MDSDQTRDIETVKILKEQESKLHFFLVTLALGVLAFSIETFDHSKDYQYTTILILAWLSLLISVFAGIFQIKWRLAVEVGHRNLTAKEKDYEKVEMAKNHLAKIVQGGSLRQFNIDELKKMASSYEDAVKVLQEDVDKRSQEVYIRSLIQEWALMIGLIALAFFRILNIVFVQR